MNKIERTSLDLEKLNVEKIKELFPNVVTEGKIDFDKLKIILGDQVDDRVEKYQFTWNGKSNTIKLAQSPSTGTLIPSKDDSKNWDTTENLYIEGDNLEVLKQLQKTYYGKIKMIYIDPPYNTGGDFVYKDDFKDSIQNYKEQTKQTSRANPETNGRYHTDWLNMMYSRLMLAKNLLSIDGLILISIDENEVNNLRKICDEIYGESNYRNSILVRRRVKSLNLQFAENGLTSFNVGTEYVLVYSKSEKGILNDLRMKKKIENPKGSWNVFWSNADRPTMRYNLLGFTPETGQWRWSQEKALSAVDNYQKYLDKYADKMTLEEYWISNNKQHDYIRRIDDGYGKNGGVQYWVGPNNYSLRTSNWTDIEVSQIHKEFDLPFENPKNIDLIIELLKLNRSNDYTILDFFSGSATTAHAVMKLNAEDGGKRKFILVQLPEFFNDSSEAYTLGFRNVCDIGKRRIKLAAEKIKQELLEKEANAGLLDDNIVDPNNFDNGFKVFKLESTNIIPWDGTIKFDENTIFSQTEVIKEDRTNFDVLYEIMLKYGVFDKPVEEIKVNGKTMYSIAKGYLIVCLDNNISLEDVKEIGKLKPRNVIFKESGFRNDNDKINATYTLEKLGVEEVKSI